MFNGSIISCSHSTYVQEIPTNFAQIGYSFQWTISPHNDNFHGFTDEIDEYVSHVLLSHKSQYSVSSKEGSFGLCLPQLKIVQRVIFAVTK
jgi:hypothetical protein